MNLSALIAHAARLADALDHPPCDADLIDDARQTLTDLYAAIAQQRDARIAIGLTGMDLVTVILGRIAEACDVNPEQPNYRLYALIGKALEGEEWAWPT